MVAKSHHPIAMSDKLLLYDALYSLSKGDELYSLPDTEGFFGFRLEHCREVYLVFDKLLENDWIYLHKKTEHLEIYRLTEAGYYVFEEGREWYKNLPFYKKVLGRLGFPI